MGISVAGTRALGMRGRKTGKRRSVVINLLTVNGVDYLVSPRGTTQWVRNARAAGIVDVGPLASAPNPYHRGGRYAKPDLLRRYLNRWYWEVKGHIAGLTPNSTEDELRAAALSIPVFALANPQ